MNMPAFTAALTWLNTSFWMKLIAMAAIGIGAASLIRIHDNEVRRNERQACNLETTTARATVQTKRAQNAEKQRDIANAPPASVDDMLDWLRGSRPRHGH